MDIIVFIFQLLSVIFNFIKEPEHLLFALVGFASGILCVLTVIFNWQFPSLSLSDVLQILLLLCLIIGGGGALGGVVGGRLGASFGRKGQIICAVIGGGITSLLVGYVIFHYM